MQSSAGALLQFVSNLIFSDLDSFTSFLSQSWIQSKLTMSLDDISASTSSRFKKYQIPYKLTLSLTFKYIHLFWSFFSQIQIKCQAVVTISFFVNIIIKSILSLLLLSSLSSTLSSTASKLLKQNKSVKQGFWL